LDKLCEMRNEKKRKKCHCDNSVSHWYDGPHPRIGVEATKKSVYMRVSC
jgi:hypothetical protein